MNLNLREKVIAVSSGAKGIGAGIVSRLALEETYAVLIDSDEAACQRTLEGISAAGGFGQFIIADLSDPAQCEIAIAEVMNRFGRIDGLVNNDTTQEAFHLLTQHALEHLKQRNGVIVNVFRTEEEMKHTATTAWAEEFQPFGIRVNAVLTKDDAHFAEEVGNAVAFLLSKKSSRTTGQLLVVG